MFTGIITNLGKIKSKTKHSLSITSERKFIEKINKGDSISVNGICLTVTKTRRDYFVIDFMKETANKTNIIYLKINDLVNLELPATPNSFLSGHIVLGHIDNIGVLKEITKAKILKFTVSKSVSKYLVTKGSITINGISLTVIEAKSNYFTVGIIPHTWENTMLHALKLGDLVNIEVDILAKYIERLIR